MSYKHDYISDYPYMAYTSDGNAQSASSDDVESIISRIEALEESSEGGEDEGGEGINIGSLIQIFDYGGETLEADASVYTTTMLNRLSIGDDVITQGASDDTGSYSTQQYISAWVVASGLTFRTTGYFLSSGSFVDLYDCTIDFGDASYTVLTAEKINDISITSVEAPNDNLCYEFVVPELSDGHCLVIHYGGISQ